MLPNPPLASDQPLALFLDFDGTLVDIAPRPEDVVVTESLRALLESLYATLGGALAVVSGRHLDDLLGHLAPLSVPAAGSHGVEYQLRPGYRVSVSKICLPPSFWRDLQDFVAAHPGLLLEHKGHGAAVHYRQAPTLGLVVEERLEALRQRDAPDFMLQAGKMVWELRPAGINKGNAIERLMDSSPFAGRLPVFVGDDITDEDAFRVVNQQGGWTIRVGENGQRTEARMGLQDVAAVCRWLELLNAGIPRHCA